MGNVLLFTSVFINLVVYGLVALWYLVPWTRRVSFAQAMLPLALWHGLRTVGTSFWMPTVTGSELPSAFSDPAVIGDLIAAGLGITVALLLRYKRSGAVMVGWVFNLWGFGDLLLAFYNGLSNDLTSYSLGPTWYIPTFIVPTMLVTHMVMFWLLAKRGHELRNKGTLEVSALTIPVKS